MTTPTQTTDERRIAERYLQVLADVARCDQAVREGDWSSLATTADELSRHAAQLAQATAARPTAAQTTAPVTNPFSHSTYTTGR